MKAKITMENRLLTMLMQRIEAENLPIELSIGKKHKDYNGDIQVDVLVECEDEKLYNDILCEIINTEFCLP